MLRNLSATFVTVSQRLVTASGSTACSCMSIAMTRPSCLVIVSYGKDPTPCGSCTDASGFRERCQAYSGQILKEEYETERGQLLPLQTLQETGDIQTCRQPSSPNSLQNQKNHFASIIIKVKSFESVRKILCTSAERNTFRSVSVRIVVWPIGPREKKSQTHLDHKMYRKWSLFLPSNSLHLRQTFIFMG